MKLLACLGLLAGLAAAQEPAARVIGEVTAVDAGAGQIALKPDAGAPVAVSLTPSTLFLRVAPGEKDLKKASRITLKDVVAGDRVLARGRMADGKLQAASIVVMSKADLARKHEADRAEWQRRGLAGTVTAVDAASHEISISIGPSEGGRSAILGAANASFRRYAPGSVRFSDAQPSSFEQVQVGDQLRALGDKNADGTRVQAEEIVFGSFRSIAAQVKTVNTADGEIRATDLESKKPIVIHVASDTQLRRMPPMIAQMLAQRLGGGSGAGFGGRPEGGRVPGAAGGPPAGGPQQGWRPSGGGPAGGTPPNNGGPNGGRRPDFQQMLERMPVLTLTELKPGDAIILSATRSNQPAEVTAITLLAGVEPLLSSGESSITGMWNFEIGMP